MATAAVTSPMPGLSSRTRAAPCLSSLGSHTLNDTADTILSSRSRISHPETHSQARRGLPDGRCENSHLGRPRRLSTDPRASCSYTLTRRFPFKRPDLGHAVAHRFKLAYRA